MAESTILPLTLLYTRHRSSVDGATRFQKLVFLAQQETDLPDKYSYQADKFGPFSPQLHSDLEELAARGLLERNEHANEVGDTKYVYSITPDGIELVKTVLNRNGSISKVFDTLQNIKKRYNDEPLQDLLRYVYRSYPTYATKSELDTDRLFDPDTRSQFLESDSDAEFVGTAPGEWKEVNSSAEDIFSV
jgi:uncharacterized protein YwgA